MNAIFFFCTTGVFVHLSFPQTSDWTNVYHHEALVALSYWRSVHQTEESIKVFIF